MEITYRIDGDILYISMNGRVDASNALNTENEILQIKRANAGKHLVLDAENLQYISSAGLRVILKLRKEDAKLAIINVNPTVYDIFDMTGFTDMVTIEKAYRRMSVEGCEFIAQGANGAVYRYDEETILKIYFARDALPEIKQERENARKAFVMGINTAIPYGIVRVGEGYGTVTELLNAESVTQIIRRDPENLQQPVKYYVDMLKSIHAIEAADGDVPDMREKALQWAEYVMPHIPAQQSKKLRALIEAVPRRNTMMHGDYHTNNIMVQNGEPVLIDMDTLCMGHPVFELASMFNAFVGYSETNHQNMMDFFGITFETAGKFWKMALKAYLGTEDEARCQAVEEKAMVIGYTRMLRRALRRPQEPESPAKIIRCKQMLAELLSKVDSLDF